MGKLKSLLPDTWFELDEKDITKVIVNHVGFEDEMLFENGECISSKTFVQLKTNGIKESIEKALICGYRFEIHLKNKEVLKIGK